MSTLHIPPGRVLALVGENGSGKTTLIKLLTRLYHADRRAHPARRPRPARMGRGRAAPAHRRHLPGLRALPAACVGENIGAGDVRDFDDEAALARGRPTRAWRRRSSTSCRRATSTQLGKWFKDGRELSGGQWQKIALSRAFMRNERRHPGARRADRGDGRAAPKRPVFEHFRALDAATASRS